MTDFTWRVQDSQFFNCVSVQCLQEMRKVGVEISKQREALTLGVNSHSLVMTNVILWLKWAPNDNLHYTDETLRTLHIRFGHPSERALTKVLKRARAQESSVRNDLEAIARDKTTCAKHSHRPKRFKVTVGTEKHTFNPIVAIDIVKIEGHNVLHNVDENTYLGAASIVSSMRSKTVWKALLKCWILVYLGPPDFLRVDQGSRFVSSSELKSSAL